MFGNEYKCVELWFLLLQSGKYSSLNYILHFNFFLQLHFFEFYNFTDKKKKLLGLNVERSNKNHKIIKFVLSLCLLSPSLSDAVTVLPLLRYFRKEIFNIIMFRPILNVGGDHGTPPVVSAYKFIKPHTKPLEPYVYILPQCRGCGI